MLFGAGAEIGYGMPHGGKFALDIFRQDTKNVKNIFKELREKIDKGSSYAANWLPEDFDKKRIHAFGEKVFENIIRDTVGNNREKVIKRINEFDEIARNTNEKYKKEKNINIDGKIKEKLDKDVTEININHQLKYSKFFTEGNALFTNNYFAALLLYYNQMDDTFKYKKVFGELIKSIFQLQLGAMSEDISRSIEDNIFSKDELDLDIFDDLGGNLKVNYELAGVKGLELLANKNEIFDDELVEFAFDILEIIYADVLDYKSLIDSNWHYLYNPKNEWAKFCKIAIFLYTVQEYIEKMSKNLALTREGYYDDLGKVNFDINIVATTNYNNFIETKSTHEVIYLNGGVNEFYDPYLNKIGKKEDLNKHEEHFIVPLMFTQSGTKPMTSIDMAEKYVNFYNEMKNSDILCSIGFGFNPDDEHINNIIRKLIDEDEKELVIFDVTRDVHTKKSIIIKSLKIKNQNRIHVVDVDVNSRTKNDKIWYQILEEILH